MRAWLRRRWWVAAVCLAALACAGVYVGPRYFPSGDRLKRQHLEELRSREGAHRGSAVSDLVFPERHKFYPQIEVAIASMFNDPDPSVRVRAAMALLNASQPVEGPRHTGWKHASWRLSDDDALRVLRAVCRASVTEPSSRVQEGRMAFHAQFWYDRVDRDWPAFGEAISVMGRALASEWSAVTEGRVRSGGFLGGLEEIAGREFEDRAALEAWLEEWTQKHPIRELRAVRAEPVGYAEENTWSDLDVLFNHVEPSARIEAIGRLVRPEALRADVPEITRVMAAAAMGRVLDEDPAPSVRMAAAQAIGEWFDCVEDEDGSLRTDGCSIVGTYLQPWAWRDATGYDSYAIGGMRLTPAEPEVAAVLKTLSAVSGQTFEGWPDVAPWLEAHPPRVEVLEALGRASDERVWGDVWP